MEKKVRRNYAFHGAVLRYDRPVMTNWRTHTIAVSDAQARSNLRAQAARRLGLTPNVRLKLEGELTAGSIVFESRF